MRHMITAAAAILAGFIGTAQAQDCPIEGVEGGYHIDMPAHPPSCYFEILPLANVGEVGQRSGMGSALYRCKGREVQVTSSVNTFYDANGGGCMMSGRVIGPEYAEAVDADFQPWKAYLYAITGHGNTTATNALDACKDARSSIMGGFFHVDAVSTLAIGWEVDTDPLDNLLASFTCSYLDYDTVLDTFYTVRVVGQAFCGSSAVPCGEEDYEWEWPQGRYWLSFQAPFPNGGGETEDMQATYRTRQDPAIYPVGVTLRRAN